ncbi:hypothetical protein CCACVL1_30609 [Corchorus capsularis]|uniref:Uncharacterized protein n=1 Tax=Corchorus capsularis TaxID=210143 RepID=A0A1R3FWJ8_COCAP|nr:hypothetical protein CCACVL1_30609 [Corchorus capsularis]
MANDPIHASTTNSVVAIKGQTTIVALVTKPPSCFP